MAALTGWLKWTAWRLRCRKEAMLDTLTRWIAWRLPRRLVRWCTVRLLANATSGKWDHQIVPDLTAMDALSRW